MGHGKKNFAFIGCGVVAHYHADVILALGHKILGVSSRPNSNKIDAFSKKYNIDFYYDDYQKMLEELKPDAIIICTSWDQTEKIIGDVINSGIPALVEKPFALSTEKITDLLEEMGQLSDNILVGYNRRFYDFIPELKKTIASHELLSSHLNFPEAVSYLLESHSSKIQNHVLLYMSSHWIDLAMYLLGDIEISFMRKKYNNRGHVISYNGLLKSINGGVPIHYSSEFDSPQVISIRFVFSNSVWELSPIEILTVYEVLERIEPTSNFPLRRYLPKIFKKYQTDLRYKPGFFKQMEYFIEAYLLGECAKDRGCTVKEALKLTQFCDQIQN
ncbi:Gfo/Idh/MocA family oxidoreductase [bacterium]|nr:Gfo/Idh/MocA family oxidoreductase [bacterium]